MDEFRRQAYLKAMGIPVWLPRVQLPNAKPAFLLNYEPPESLVLQKRSASAKPKVPIVEAQAAENVVAPVAVARPATQDLINAIAQTPAEKPVEQASKPVVSKPMVSKPIASKRHHEPSAKPEKKPEAPLKGTTIAKPPKFSLQMYRLSPSCFVVSDCSLGEDSSFQSGRHNLLLSMLKATFKSDFTIDRCDYCHWPLVKNPQVDQGPLVAQQAVAQLVATRCQSITALKVLLMGDAAKTYASGFPVYMNESEARRVITISVSLDDLLTDPKRKREAWSDIKRCLEA